MTAFTAFTFPATGASTSRTMPARLAEIVNVKDFGATGDGSTDDAAAIQSAINAAFGTAASPHGNSQAVNRPLYFPKGVYKTLSPLVITNAWGGRIYGDGMQQSVISFLGTVTPIDANNICPALWMNGGNFCHFSDLSFSAPSDTTNHYTACIWFGPDGVATSSAHGNQLTNIGTTTASNGIVHGSTGSAANSENTYIDCTLHSHEQYGLFLSGANTLNMRFIGGGIDSCGIGIKLNNSASCPIILNTAFSQNKFDIETGGTSTMTVVGVRTESSLLLHHGGSGAVVNLVNCDIAMPNCTFTGATSGTTLTVSAIGSGTLRPGMFLVGTDATNSFGTISPDTVVVKQLTGSAGSTGTYQISAAGSPGNISSTSMTGYAVFAMMDGSGITVIDNCRSGYTPILVGRSNSQMDVRANLFSDSNTALLTYHLGVLLRYDIAGKQSTTVASLPTAQACLKGIRLYVTDGSVAASGNFGAIVAGSGSNIVPVFCDGTNWRIG